MAKVPFSKLGVKYTEFTVPVQFNSQTFGVKQYLPIQEKLDMIGKILEMAHEQDSNYANPVKVDVFTALNILEYYTDISFTAKQKENLPKLYDTCAQSGLLNVVLNAIPKEELDIIYKGVERTITSVYAYQNSALGIVEAIGSEASDIGSNANDIYSKLADPNNLTLLRDILTKLGPA